MLNKRHLMIAVLGTLALLMISAVWVTEVAPPWRPEDKNMVLSPGPADIVVTMSVDRQGDTATYSITLRNPGDSEVKDIFIAGAIAQGTTFVEAGPNPARGWFRGVEGGNAVFLSEGVPAMGWQAFSYRVKLSGDTADPVWAWVHWRLPRDTTGVSRPVKVLPSVTVALLASGPVGKLPQEPLIWRAGEVHEPAQKSSSPSVSQFARMTYQFEGVRVLTQEGVATAYSPGSGYFVKGGARALSAVPGDTPARLWTFVPVPLRLQDEGVAPIARVIFKSEELKGLKDASYNMLLIQAEFQPGGNATPHWHPGPGLVYVLEGTLIHRERGTTHTYGPGSFWVEETGEPNSTENIGNTTAKVIAAFLIPEGEAPATFLAEPHPWLFR